MRQEKLWSSVQEAPALTRPRLLRGFISSPSKPSLPNRRTEKAKKTNVAHEKLACPKCRPGQPCQPGKDAWPKKLQVSPELRTISLRKRLALANDFHWALPYASERKINEAFDYKFQDKDLLWEALQAGKTPIRKIGNRTIVKDEGNKRLALLGDKILAVVMFYNRCFTQKPDNIKEVKGNFLMDASNAHLAVVAARYGLSRIINGHDPRFGSTTPYMTATLVEALIGGIFIDSRYNLQTTRRSMQHCGIWEPVPELLSTAHSENGNPLLTEHSLVETAFNYQWKHKHLLLEALPPAGNSDNRITGHNVGERTLELARLGGEALQAMIYMDWYPTGLGIGRGTSYVNNVYSVESLARIASALQLQRVLNFNHETSKKVLARTIKALFGALCVDTQSDFVCIQEVARHIGIAMISEKSEEMG